MPEACEIVEGGNALSIVLLDLISYLDELLQLIRWDSFNLPLGDQFIDAKLKI